MRREEFAKELKELRYDIDFYEDYTDVVKQYDSYGSISELNTNCLDTNYKMFNELDYDTQSVLLDLMVKYAKTPLKVRNIEKKYWLIWHESIVSMEGCNNILALNELSEDFYFIVLGRDKQYKSQFTKAEMKKFPKKIRELIELGYIIPEEVK